jgi:hypothetical protein
MRKVEQEMIRAFISGTSLRIANDKVVTDGENTKWYLHNNLIAEYIKEPYKTVNLYDAGWRTNTTKSRLNALLDWYVPGTRIHQKNYQWFVDDHKWFGSFTIENA